MQSVIMISDIENLLEKIELLFKTTLSKYQENNVLNLELNNGRLYITASNNISDDFSKEEIKFLSEKCSQELYFYLVCYSDEQVLKQLLSELCFLKKIYIDDDIGHIVSINEFMISNL